MASNDDNRNDIPRGEAIFRKEDCSPFDIGVVFYDLNTFSDQRKQEFIENVWSPRGDPLIIQFPKVEGEWRQISKV